MGLEIAKAKAYAAHERKGLSGIMHRKTTPIAIVVNMLCKHTVRNALHASAQDQINALHASDQEAYIKFPFRISTQEIRRLACNTDGDPFEDRMKTQYKYEQ